MAGWALTQYQCLNLWMSNNGALWHGLIIKMLTQGSHRLDKYLNIQACLEKSLKIKFALKSTWKTLKGLEKSFNFTIYRKIQHCFWRPKSV